MGLGRLLLTEGFRSTLSYIGCFVPNYAFTNCSRTRVRNRKAPALVVEVEISARSRGHPALDKAKSIFVVDSGHASGLDVIPPLRYRFFRLCTG